MKDINKRPLKVAVHGFDARASKMMAMYFKSLCHGAALLAQNQSEADIDLFDYDLPESKKGLTAYLQKPLSRPVMVLSVQDFAEKDTLVVKKPVQVDDMLRAIAEAKKLIKKAARPLVKSKLMASESLLSEKRKFEGASSSASVVLNPSKSLTANPAENNKTVVESATAYGDANKADSLVPDSFENDWFDDWLETQPPDPDN